ncbi:Ankyrin repeat [Melia azedarach]|uniref:Ankyrin repeat n=1 Tax=Melia azedarach TaxID=155640 RepID=A0ACC1Y0R4_MELAZ|nr:Ankyrin repeat [Melia azedarach]
MEEANEAKQHKDDETNTISKQDKEHQATTKLDHDKELTSEGVATGISSNTIHENRNKDETTEAVEDDLDEQTTEEDSSEDDWSAYWPLCKMIQENDWKCVEDFVGDHPEALTTKISGDSKTIFHYIANFTRDDVEGAVFLIDKLASKVHPSTLEQESSAGLTVLSLCAIIGNTRASQSLVKYNTNLPNVCSNQWLPVQDAAVYGHKDTVQYLVQVTTKENLVGSQGASLISELIKSNLYGQYFRI